MIENKASFRIHKIDLDNEVFNFADSGILRAYAFAGCICNELNSLVLKAVHPCENYRLNNPDFDNLTLVKQEFINWTLVNCMSEIIEAISYTLDRLFVILYCANTPSKAIGASFAKIEKNFSKQKFPEKLEKIGKFIICDISNEIEILKALQNIRNCFTHHKGIVAKKDGITLKMPEVKLEIEKPNGEVLYYNMESIKPDLPLDIDKGTYISYSINFLERHFNEGEYLSISSSDIAKIAFMANLVIKNIRLATFKTLQHSLKAEPEKTSTSKLKFTIKI